jgi:two-component system phosphate regulon sensor histidine kinase PhoR
MMNRFVETIAEQRESLQIANENQTNLIHVMNHQVKGRLGNAKNVFAELLSGQYGAIPQEATPLLTKGLEEVTTGVEYVQGILKGASAQSGTLPYDMKPMDLKSLLASLIARQKPIAEQKGLTFIHNVAAGDYPMTGDTTQLGEALGNLIDNAIKYNVPKGTITVTLRHDEDTSGKILFSVADTGIGISDEDKAKLFKAGGRGKDSIKYNTDSTGYGLAFVKAVVEKHGGRVWSQANTPAAGTTFFVELPAKLT